MDKNREDCDKYHLAVDRKYARKYGGVYGYRWPRGREEAHHMLTGFRS